MISMQSMHFSYPGQPLFTDLTWDLEAGTVYGLLGRNGAGKTTLLKLMSGLLFRKEGRIEVLGQDPEHRSPDLLNDIFFINEEIAIPDMSAAQYEGLYAGLYPSFSHEDFQRYLKEFEVDPQQSMAKMSFGQKKKTVLAFGLASNTRILVLDEPTNALDIPSKGQFRRLLAGAVSDDRVIVVSTHQVRDLDQLIDPITILENGQVVFQHSVDEITERLSFGFSNTEPDDALYSERSMGGFACITKNDGTEDSRIDLELLFNAVTTNAAEISDAFSKEALV